MTSATHIKKIERFHYLSQDLEHISHARQVEQALSAGVKWVQLRTKGRTEAEWEAIALAVKQLTDIANATLIINDNPALALKIGAAGVHLGKEDMDPAEARKMLGPDFIIGATVNNAEDMERVMHAPIDYIGIGPYRHTATKEKLSKVLKVEELKALVEMQQRLPLIIIGGIRANDISAVMDHGLHGMAVSSAVNLADEPAQAASVFLKKIESYVL